MIVARFRSSSPFKFPNVRDILPGLLVLCVLLAGCAVSREDVRVAERNVDTFHSELNAEQYSAIYRSADARIKATNESDYIKFLQSVHQELGAVKGSVLRFEGIAIRPPTVTLNYETTFERGNGKEVFMWRIKNHEAILDHYSIDSNDLHAK